METKIAYQTNEQGYYVGHVDRQSSPLEPGHWLLPGGAVEEAPPEIPENHRCKWNGSAWELEEILPEPAPEEPQAPAVEPIQEEAPQEEESPVEVMSTKKKKSK